jgi:molybdate transport system substrate-binding protein
MNALYLLSGGAAQGLVRTFQAPFEASSSFALQCTFSAAGAIHQKLLDGEPCDVLILTRSLIDMLVRSGKVVPASARDLGTVKAGVAVKAGAPHPDVHDADSLRAALRAASAIYLPDPQLATAGIHVMKVINALGLAEELAERLRPYPNGNTAMTAMAKCEDMHVIGSTQVTEILITQGVDLVADLPKEFELATVYTAAVSATAVNPKAAENFIALLAHQAQAELRAQVGFLPAMG